MTKNSAKKAQYKKKARLNATISPVAQEKLNDIKRRTSNRLAQKAADHEKANAMEEDPIEPTTQNTDNNNSAPSQPNASTSTADPQSVNEPAASNDSTNENGTQNLAGHETNQQPPIPDEAYEKITRRTPFRAATLLENIKGKSTSDKCKQVCIKFGAKQGYAGK